MKRMMKTLGSIVLAASLVLGVFAQVVPAKAADAMDPAEFKALFEKVDAATSAVLATTNTQMVGDVSLNIPLIGNTNSVIKNTIDVNNHAVCMEVESEDAKTYTYTDTQKKCAYTYNSTNQRYEVDKSSLDPSLISQFTKYDITELPGVTLTKAADKTIDNHACQGVTAKVALSGEALEKVMSKASETIGGKSLPITGGSALGDVDLATASSSIDLAITVYADENFILRSVNITGSVVLDILSSSLTIDVDANIFCNGTTESVTIPDEYVKKAQLVEGFVVKASGAKFKSALSGANTVFSVTGVVKTAAKKLTIPATISQFGKSYKVTKAAKNAFKKAKKLKTLIVKNASLKKAIKKSPTKYGLKKSVKIK